MSTKPTFSRSQLIFCLAAGLSLVASVSLWFSGYKEQGLFIGLWVPSILALGTLLIAGRAVRG